MHDVLTATDVGFRPQLPALSALSRFYASKCMSSTPPFGFSLGFFGLEKECD